MSRTVIGPQEHPVSPLSFPAPAAASPTGTRVEVETQEDGTPVTAKQSVYSPPSITSVPSLLNLTIPALSGVLALPHGPRTQNGPVLLNLRGCKVNPLPTHKPDISYAILASVASSSQNETVFDRESSFTRNASWLSGRKAPNSPTNGALVLPIHSKPNNVAPAISVRSHHIPKVNLISECEAMSTQNCLAKKNLSRMHDSGVSTVMTRILHVGITLEKPETLNSWGLVFTKEKSNYALIARIIHPANDERENRPSVKWCRIAHSTPNPSVVYRTTSTSIMPLDKYEAFIARNFPPQLTDNHLGSGVLVPYLQPGDAIISVNGLPVSAFPTMRKFASFIQKRCRTKMIVVAMRHENAWMAAVGQILTKRGCQEQKEGQGGLIGDQATSDRISKDVRDMWRRTLVCHAGSSNNCNVKRKAVYQPTTKKLPKVYSNFKFRDGMGNPIPYCDNDDVFDPDDGKRIHAFVNDEIQRSFCEWLRKRKSTWKQIRPENIISQRIEDVIDKEATELIVQRKFWLANGYESFSQWLLASKTKWARSYSWHQKKRKALQLECERQVHFPMGATTSDEIQDLLNQFENWLGVRRHQWRLERRKRHRQRADLSCSLTNDQRICSRRAASTPVWDCFANDPNPSTTTSNKYLDEILEHQAHLTHKRAPRQPMDISWVFDSQLGAPDDVVMNMMTFLHPSDHGNLLCLSYASTYLFKQRNVMWRTLCPNHWILPRRPRKSWCALYISKIRSEEEASRKRSDDVLVKANAIVQRGDQLNKLEKLVLKAQKDFNFSVNYTSGVVLERNSLLNMAVIDERHKIVKWLIDHKGADIESCDRGQFTPLLNAAWNGDKYMVRYLLGKGSDRTKVGFNHSSQGLAPASFEGLNAEGWACKRGHKEISELIRIGL